MGSDVSRSASRVRKAAGLIAMGSGDRAVRHTNCSGVAGPLHPSHRRVELVLDPRKPLIVETLDVRRSPVGRAIARRPRAWIRRCAHAIAASSCCSTHEGPSPLDASTLKTTPVGELWLDARVPGFAAAPKPSSRRASARTTQAFNRGDARCPEIPRGSSSSSTPAFLDSTPRPSYRRDERARRGLRTQGARTIMRPSVESDHA
jgi:hypothetical protein